MPSIRPENPIFSIIVPVFNEHDAIPSFINKTKSLLEDNHLSFEIIFINDGSTDHSFDLMLDFAKKDQRIKIINFSRNFGKEAALSAGIDHAIGDALIPIDVDLQDPPELIPKMIAHWKTGYDVVYGLRVSRDSDSLFKRTSANMFYKVFNKLSPLQIPPDAGDFRLIDRRVAEVLKNIPERSRFMKGLFSWVGFKSIAVPYQRPNRKTGKTKWSTWKLWNFALDGLLSFSTLPLRIWTYIGVTIAIMSFFYGSFIVVRTLIFGIDLPGYASMLTVILFLGGMQLISIGILGEYIGRIFIESKNRPLYVIDSKYPFN
jgi:glycosyltransferase involved in cell wall biosynthesis